MIPKLVPPGGSKRVTVQAARASGVGSQFITPLESTTYSGKKKSTKDQRKGEGDLHKQEAWRDQCATSETSSGPRSSRKAKIHSSSWKTVTAPPSLGRASAQIKRSTKVKMAYARPAVSYFPDRWARVSHHQFPKVLAEELIAKYILVLLS